MVHANDLRTWGAQDNGVTSGAVLVGVQVYEEPTCTKYLRVSEGPQFEVLLLTLLTKNKQKRNIRNYTDQLN